MASHEILFQASEERRCDACATPLAEDDEQGGYLEEGYELPGTGVYLWIRGDQVQLEKAPLCAPCASAIGMTALARWEIEEEEG